MGQSKQSFRSGAVLAFVCVGAWTFLGCTGADAGNGKEQDPAPGGQGPGATEQGLASEAASLDDRTSAVKGRRPKCIRVRGDLVETRRTEGCKPEHKSCFRGELSGRHGFHATTYFKGDSSVSGPETSPGSFAYSGQFEYTTEHGTLVTRETGVNVPDGEARLAVTAHQKITAATGELSGATGHFFVSGFVTDVSVITEVTGEVCLP